MSAINDGGPAFPGTESNGLNSGWAGLSLRDYLAANALPPVFEAAMQDARNGSGLFKYPDWRTGIALDAYEMADAMLKAREVGAS